VHVVREEETDPRAQEFIAGLLTERMGAGYHTHFAAAADPSLSMTLLGALRRGEVVALQADRPRRGGKTLRLDLFGRPYDFPAGPLVLARSAGVPLVPVFVYREGRLSYRVVVEEPVEVPQTADRAADLAAAGRRVAAAVETAIRRRPHQWFCFGRAWPAGGRCPSRRQAAPSRCSSPAA
jgi:lauroyl/myristoyl acyltransferase